MSEGNRVIGVGLLGLGTVGSAVYELLEDMAKEFATRFDVSFDVRKVLVRNVEKRRSVQVPDERFTSDIDEVLGDPEVKMVVEVMGGVDPTLGHVTKAIRTGRPVVTANKHMLAEKGAELEALALNEGVHMRYEASVGAVVPVVSALWGGVHALNVREVSGILNGTCNHILTEMYNKDMDYSKALKDAQNLGLAEASPEMDVSGQDTAHKLCVLSRVVFGRFFPLEKVDVEGIGPGIGVRVSGAKHHGRKVKLLGYLCRSDEDGETMASVRPEEVEQSSCFYRVDGNENMVRLSTYDTGDINICGRGAGGKETATAVVSDMLAQAVEMRKK
jgi:homoserine dehydrogenase